MNIIKESAKIIDSTYAKTENYFNDSERKKNETMEHFDNLKAKSMVQKKINELKKQFK